MSKVQRICIDGLGIALFVVLSLCLRVPVFENYYLCLGYIVMAVYCKHVGILDGIIVSVIGTVLYCILISGMRGMPGWAIGNIAISICFGYGIKLGNKINNNLVRLIIEIIGIIVGVTIGILGIKSTVEVVLYAQPFIVRTINNIYAYIADIAVLLISIPICEVVSSRLNHRDKDKNNITNIADIH